MDPNLLQRSIAFHGPDLIEALNVEQGQQATRNIIGVKNLAADNGDSFVADHGCNNYANTKTLTESRQKKLISFIAKKADMLFRNKETSSVPAITNEMEYRDYCAILPPVDYFMNVSEESRKMNFYETIGKGDIIVGSVVGKHTHGLIIQLVCMSAGRMLYIHDLFIKCFCNTLHIPTSGSVHEDPLEAYEVNDLVQGVVLDVQPSIQKLYISMKDSALPFALQRKFKLGLIAEEALPIHYRGCLSAGGELYETMLEHMLGFMNPSAVCQLCGLLGLDLDKRPSLMRGLHMKKFPKEDYASELYKVQCAKWAYKSVEQGVHHFKQGNKVEAFQCLNKALQIDPVNVEALVARGALFANSSSFKRALEDFFKAIDLNPNHLNATKFSVETLIALGKQYEEQTNPEEALKCYRKALKLNPLHLDAMHCMKASQQKAHDRERDKARQIALDARNEAGCSRDAKSADRLCSTPVNTKEKLKRLLSVERSEKQHEYRRKIGKRLYSESASSSSSSSSSSHSSRRSRIRAKTSRSKYGRRNDSSSDDNCRRSQLSRHKRARRHSKEKRRSNNSTYSDDSSLSESSCDRNKEKDWQSARKQSESGSSSSVKIVGTSERQQVQRQLSETGSGQKSDLAWNQNSNSCTGSVVSCLAASSKVIGGSGATDAKDQGKTENKAVDRGDNAKGDTSQSLEELESFLATLKAKKGSKTGN